MIYGHPGDSIPALVIFPANKALAEVGYTLYNSDGTLNQARTIVGVTRLAAAFDQAWFIAVLTKPDDWSGYIVWDTGDGLSAPEEVYISANIDPAVVQSIQLQIDALQVDLGDPSAESTTILAKVKDLDKGSGTIARTLSSMGADYFAKLNGVALAGVTVKAYLKTDLNHIRGQITTDAAGDGMLYLSTGTQYVLYYEYQGSVLTKEYTVP
jgi:hypothetical protein